MDHDEPMELAAEELAAALDQIEQRGTCPDCLAELLLRVAVGIRQAAAIPAINCTDHVG